MKKFMKKLAFVMALAMVITSIPAFTAKAATNPSLKYSSRVLYIGENTGCWTPVQNKGDYETSYSTTSDKITVNADNGKIVIAENATPGKAVVTVTYSLNGKVVSSENFTLKLRRSATAARLTNATAAALTEAPLAVGAEVKLSVAKSIDGSYKKGHYGLDNYTGVVTDQVSLVSSDPEVLAVDGLTVKALKAGKATVSIVLTKYLSKEVNTAATTKSYDVVVEDAGITSVTQKDATTLVVTLGAADESISASSFSIVKKSTNQVYAVNTAVADKNDATKITVTTFMTMTDGAEYTITYGDSSVDFTATTGTVSDIVIAPSTVEAESATKVYANLIDANGVVIATVDAENPIDNVDFTVETTEGYTIGNTLVLFEAGNKATVKVTIHSGKYDDYGNEVGNITKEATVVAVAKSAVVNGDLAYTIANAAVDFTSFTQNLTLAVGDDGYSVYAYLKNSANEDVTQNSSYTLESADKDILVVGATTNNTLGVCATIVAVGGAGTTSYVLVKNGDGKIVASIPVTIKADRTLTNFTLDKTTATVSNSDKLNDQIAAFTVKPVDQYNSSFDATITAFSALTFPSASSKADAETAVTNVADPVGTTTLKFDANSMPAGTYTFKITVGNKLTKVVTVVVKAPSATATPVYKLILSDSSVDVAFTNTTKTPNKSVTVKIGDYRNGILYQYVNASTSGINNVVYDFSLNGVTKGSVDTLPVRTISGEVVTKAAVGVYNVTVTFDDGTKDYSLKASFTVTDSQPALTVVRNKVEATGTNVTDEKSAVEQCFDFYYNGVKLTTEQLANLDVTNVTLYTAATTDVNGNTVYAIKSATATYKVDGTNAVTFTVNVGKTITATN